MKCEDRNHSKEFYIRFMGCELNEMRIDNHDNCKTFLCLFFKDNNSKVFDKNIYVFAFSQLFLLRTCWTK